jgi:hypothetical protein
MGTALSKSHVVASPRVVGAKGPLAAPASLRPASRSSRVLGRVLGSALPGALGLLALLPLAGCPTVDLGDTPPDIGQCRPDRQYYIDVIWPRYLAPAAPARSCVAASGCHEAQTGRSALRLSTAAPVDHDRNYQVVTRFLNCSTPTASELLTKPLAGIEAHQGGDLFPSAADPAVIDFEGWFTP